MKLYMVLTNDVCFHITVHFPFQNKSDVDCISVMALIDGSNC